MSCCFALAHLFLYYGNSQERKVCLVQEFIETEACLFLTITAYVTVTENFERFQYLNFETYFLKIENLFQKNGRSFFS